jgi:hypothetical protein
MYWLLFHDLLFFFSIFNFAFAKTAFTPAPQTHDRSFIPNHVLRVTRKEIGVGGIRRYTTLVNDTLPGPELHIPEGQLVWIRVYNDMNDANLTMVREIKDDGLTTISKLTTMALFNSTGMVSLRQPRHSQTAPPWQANGPSHRTTTLTTS